MYVHKQQKGFIALISSVIISAILITATVTGSLSGFYTRFNILDSEFKKKSAALAEACVDIVLYTLVGDSNYMGPNMNYPVGGDTCTIFTAQDLGGGSKRFKVQGKYQNSYTTISIVVDTSGPAVTSWQETAQ